MAMFPCSDTLHRYPGPQRTMYAAVADGIVTSRVKLRLCPTHYDRRLERLERHAIPAQISLEDERELVCFSCGRKVEDGSAQLFVTCYPGGDARHDWWAPLHDGCVLATCEDWGLPASVA